MYIYEMNDNNIIIVARFMSSLKPEWWNIDGAYSQLESGFGWYMGLSEEKPMGWVLCKNYEGYRTLEIECLGYGSSGELKVGKELQPLLEKVEEWVRHKGLANIRFIIGSLGLSCHKKIINIPWVELRDLKSISRPEYDWFISMGYIPSGIMQDIYGDGFHGIELIKRI